MFVHTDAVLVTPVLEPIKPCYVSVRTGRNVYVSETMLLHGTGFAAGEALRIDVDGVTVRSVTADDAGVMDAQVAAPVISDGQLPFDVVVTPEDSSYGLPITLHSRVTDLGVTLRPKLARPSQRVRFSGSGFTDPRPIYAHYVRKGVLIRTVRLAARPATACGRFSVRRKQFPFRPRTGTYLVQIDQHSALSDAGPLVKLTIDVRRRPKTMR